MENLKNPQNYDYQKVYKNGVMPDMIDVCNKIVELVDNYNSIRNELSQINKALTELTVKTMGELGQLTIKVAHLEEKEKLLENLRK